MVPLAVLNDGAEESQADGYSLPGILWHAALPPSVILLQLAAEMLAAFLLE